MADVTVTNENKNTLSITNDSKPDGGTWADHPEAWEDNQGTWAEAGVGVALESKNSLTITNESKP